MPGVLATTGAVFQLSILRNAAIEDTFLCHLYKNDYVPHKGSVASDFTEATFDGYSPQNLNAWSSPLIDPNGDALSVEAIHTWTKSSGGVANYIWGYYVTDGTGAVLQWAERFPSVVPMETTGDTLSVVPTWRYRDCP